MALAPKDVLGRVNIVVELFGMASIASGKRSVELIVEATGNVSGLANALVQECPELAGVAVREDGDGFLASYTLNINGSRFVSGESLDLEPGDSVLLFSSQAGG